MAAHIEIRCSALSRYADCPRSAAARLFKNEIGKYGLAPSQNSAGAAIGTAVHAMMADLFRQKLETGHMDISRAAENRESQFVNELEKDTIWDATTPHIETAKKQVRALCRAFLPIAEMTDPLDFETKREAWVNPLGGQSVTVKLTGTRDVMDTNYEIHDHKTGRSFPKAHAQLGGYALLADLNDEEVRAVRINFAPRLGVTKLDDTVARSLRLDIDECRNAAWNTIREIQKHYEDFLSRKDSPEWAFPANPYSQICTEKYCSAYGTEWCKVGFCG